MPSTTATIRPTRSIVAIAVLAAALIGCGGGGGGSAQPVPSASAGLASATTAQTTHTTHATMTATTTGETTAPTTSPQVPAEPATAGSALRGVSLVDQLAVFDAPGGTELTTLPPRTAFDTPTVVGIIDQTPGWSQILVPVRPNDLTGWVRTEDVLIEEVDAEIRIDLAARTLRLIESDVLVGEWPVAVGRPDRPTPTGQFFVTDKLATGDASSVWGAHALGISAYSDVLDEFIGGIGQIGVHGTNDPTSIGQNVSSGCVRLPNEVIDALIDRLPVGTPVHIT